MTSQFSLKNTGVRRIMEEVNEMKKDPSDQYHAMPLEDNIFDWHFTLRGPKGTDFEGGFYHGRIVLPSGYPFKPPNIYFLNENGRFEIRKKICLSFSAYHPEEWQPAWGIRTILEALISFMPSKSEGAIGGLNWTKEERQKCIKKSLSYSCPHCGPIKDLIPEECIVVNEDGKEKASKNKYADAIAQMHFHAPGSNNNNNDKKKPSTTKSPSNANVSKKKPASKPKAAVVSNNTESKMNDSNLRRRNVNNNNNDSTSNNNNNDNNNNAVNDNTGTQQNNRRDDNTRPPPREFTHRSHYGDTSQSNCGELIIMFFASLILCVINFIIMRKGYYLVSNMFW